MALRDLTANIRITADTRQADNALRKSERGVESFGSSVAKVAAGIATAWAAAQTAFAAFTTAIEAQRSDRALAQLLDDATGSVANFNRELQEATNNTISQAQAATTAAQALARGIDENALPEIFESAELAAKAFGITAEDAVNRITLGITKLSPELLDEVGVTARLGEATQRWAEANNRTVTSLTAVERQAAFTQEVLRQLEVQQVALGDAFGEDGLDSLNQFTALLADLGELVSRSLVAQLGELTDAVGELTGTAGTFDTFANAVRGGLKALKDLDEQTTSLAKSNAELAKAQSGLAGSIGLTTEEYIKLLPRAQALTFELGIEYPAALKRAKAEQDAFTGSLEGANSVLAELGVRTVADIQESFRELTKQEKELREAIALGSITQLDFERGLSAISQQSRKLVTELNAQGQEFKQVALDQEAAERTQRELTQAYVDGTEATKENTEKTKEQGDATEDTTEAVREQTVALREQRVELERTGQQAVITASQFDALARSQGRAAAEAAAIESGADVILGGTRIRVRGGSRLVRTNSTTSRTGVAPSGGLFGSTGENSLNILD